MNVRLRLYLRVTSTRFDRIYVPIVGCADVCPVEAIHPAYRIPILGKIWRAVRTKGAAFLYVEDLVSRTVRYPVVLSPDTSAHFMKHLNKEMVCKAETGVPAAIQQRTERAWIYYGLA